MTTYEEYLHAPPSEGMAFLPLAKDGNLDEPYGHNYIYSIYSLDKALRECDDKAFNYPYPEVCSYDDSQAISKPGHVFDKDAISVEGHLRQVSPADDYVSKFMDAVESLKFQKVKYGDTEPWLNIAYNACFGEDFNFDTYIEALRNTWVIADKMVKTTDEHGADLYKAFRAAVKHIRENVAHGYTSPDFHLFSANTFNESDRHKNMTEIDDIKNKVNNATGDLKSSHNELVSQYTSWAAAFPKPQNAEVPTGVSVINEANVHNLGETMGDLETQFAGLNNSWMQVGDETFKPWSEHTKDGMPAPFYKDSRGLYHSNLLSPIGHQATVFANICWRMKMAFLHLSIGSSEKEKESVHNVNHAPYLDSEPSHMR